LRNTLLCQSVKLLCPWLVDWLVGWLVKLMTAHSPPVYLGETGPSI